MQPPPLTPPLTGTVVPPNAMCDDALPEVRRDPVTGRWAVVAPARAARPHAIAETAPRFPPDAAAWACPFCPGNEPDTPGEVLAHRPPGSPPDGPGWALRVVPNRYPAVAPFGTPGGGTAAGYHEVLIDCPGHVGNPAELTAGQHAAVFRAYRDRVAALSADRRVGYVSVFKNVGADAGASLPHTHSQVLATGHVPHVIADELRAADAHHAAHGRCLFCDLIRGERADGRRVVADSPGFVAVTAVAPRYAFETWVLPRRHAPHYAGLTDPEADELGGLVRRFLLALDAAAGAPAYNWFVHTAPPGGPHPAYHWHLEVLPRTACPAGFEWGFGHFVTTTTPEDAAAALRAAWERPS